MPKKIAVPVAPAMRFPVTLEALRDDPVGFAQGVFGNHGIASRVVPGFKLSVAQIDYATGLARAGARGLDPGTAGAVTFFEASTGVGKTVAYCVVGMTYALLTGQRFLVSTFTRALMHQLVGQEAEAVVAILREVLGFEGDAYGPDEVKVAFAPRRSRAAFVSPSRARRVADDLRRDGNEALAQALSAYADLAEAALGRAEAEGAEAVVGELGGLIEGFDALDPDRAELVRKVPANSYVLTSDCPDAEQALYKAYDAAAQRAVGLVVTHASLLIDASLFGRLTKARENGFAMAVIDEAHDLHRAAASAFTRRVSIRAGMREASGIVRQVEDREVGGEASDHARRELLKAARAYEAVYADLVREVTLAVEALDPEREVCIVSGREPWVRALADTFPAHQALLKALDRAGGERAEAMAADLRRDDRAIKLFFDCLAWRELNPGRVGLFLPQLVMSPRRRDPCLQVLPVKGQRIVQRLWNQDAGRGPWADAVVFTSATLATGESRGGESDYAAFEGQAFNYGIDRDTRVNKDLCKVYEAHFHGAPTFVFADPEAPYMTNREERQGLVTEAGARYLGLAIAEAHCRPNPATGQSRILVPTNSFADAAEIGRLVPEELHHLLVVREPGTSLQAALRRWRGIKDGILVTPGAHQGINEPGLIDHLMVYRLPYDPPRRVGGADGEAVEGFLNQRSEMLIKFRQALGRPIRRAEDAPTLWLLDVRVGLPQRVERTRNLLSDDRADRALLGAVPKRYRKLMDVGEVFPCPDDLKQSRRTHQPRNEEELA